MNVQNHREWIEAIINGKKNSLKIWSNGLNPGRMAKGNSMTAEMNISFIMWFNLIKISIDNLCFSNEDLNIMFRF